MPSHVNTDLKASSPEVTARPGWAAPCLQVSGPQRRVPTDTLNLPLTAVFQESARVFLQHGPLYFLCFASSLSVLSKCSGWCSSCIKPVCGHCHFSNSSNGHLHFFSHKLFLIKLCMVLFEIGSCIDEAGLELAM